MPCHPFSDVTKKYLIRYRDILDEMIREMTNVSLSDSISRNFILQMIPHHRAAIQMSENILAYTTLIPLQKIAQNIVSSQTESIAAMQSALELCSGVRNTADDLRLYQEAYRQITEEMFCGMRCALSTNQIDADFMREMIPHHLGAIRMSENALCFPICPELIPILTAIITSQKRGVCEMRRLLRRIAGTCGKF